MAYDIDTNREEIIELRRFFHRHPELSLQEFKTAEKIEDVLNQAAIPTQRIGETGVLGIITGEKGPGKIVALRADTDALAILDTKDIPYASETPGVMHACGHDAHTAALLGAALSLNAAKDSFAGEIRLIFQPGEEYGKGAKPFLEANVLENVSRVFGIHVDSSTEYGKVSLNPGAENASVDHFTIHVSGKSAHVSTPEKGVDALYAAAQIVNALQGIVSRLKSPVDPVVVGIGVLQAGDAYNVVAQSAKIEGTIRAFSPETREFVNRKLVEIATGTGAFYGATVTVDTEDFASPVINNPEVYKEVVAVAEKLIGAGNIQSKSLSLGGDNVSDFLDRVPGVYAYVGSRNPEKPYTAAAHHNGAFDVEEDAIVLAAKLHRDFALSTLNS